MRLANDQINWRSWGDDRNGRCFLHGGEYFRGIRPPFEGFFRFLLESGLLDDLAGQDLIVRTRVSDLQLEGYPLVLHHEKIPVVSYPQEWCFSMLRDAAKLILRLNQSLLQHKMILADCHPFNVLFRGSKPVFVDIGSIVPHEPDLPYPAFDEFLSNYVYPLTLQKNPALHRAIKALQSDELSGVSREEFAALSPASLRLPRITVRGRPLGKPLLQSVLLKAIQFSPQGGMLNGLLNHFRSLPGLQGVAPSTAAIQYLLRKIETLKIPLSKTQWGGYYDENILKDAEGLHAKSEGEIRGRQIMAAIRKANPRSLIDLAGNQGVFSVAALEVGVPQVVCADMDLTALEKLYRHAKTHSLELLPVFLNVMMPGGGSRDLHPEEKTVPARMQSEMALALALSHHLSLTQRIPFQTIARTLAAYTSRHLLVEFMPFGLGIGEPSLNLPDWYTLDNFVKAFRAHFANIQVCPTNHACNNRILLICQK